MAIIVTSCRPTCRVETHCDACGRRIEPAAHGVAVYAEAGGAGAAGEVRHAHRDPACLRAVEGYVRQAGDRPGRQALDEHLRGVGTALLGGAGRVARSLPDAGRGTAAPPDVDFVDDEDYGVDPVRAAEAERIFRERYGVKLGGPGTNPFLRP